MTHVRRTLPRFLRLLALATLVGTGLAHANVRLDTTMAFTEFAQAMMPVPEPVLRRLPDLGDRILFGSDFPNIPYPYAEAMIALTELPGVDSDWLCNVFYRNAAGLFGFAPP